MADIEGETWDNDENLQQNIQTRSEIKNNIKSKRSFNVHLPNESEYRKKLTTLAILDWNRETTPKRRELFRTAKVSLKSGDSKWSEVPRLVTISGITHSTWNKSIQALFSTQNCDVTFSLGSKYHMKVGVIYYQRILRKISQASPEDTVVVENEVVSIQGPVARNMFFVSSIMLSMKFFDDLHLSNKYLSKVFKLPLAHLNVWEQLALDYLDWSLTVTEVEKAQVAVDLSSHIDTNTLL